MSCRKVGRPLHLCSGCQDSPYRVFGSGMQEMTRLLAERSNLCNAGCLSGYNLNQ